MDYLRYLEKGLLDKQIAHEMGISHSGVRKHQNAVCKKFKVSRRGDIVAEAIRKRSVVGAGNSIRYQTRWIMGYEGA